MNRQASTSDLLLHAPGFEAASIGARSLSLSVRIPFCKSLCYYCTCTRLLSYEPGKALRYLDELKREIAVQGERLGPAQRVRRLQVGGGTPTCLSNLQLSELLACLRNHFDFAPDSLGDYCIEADPRTVTPARVGMLRRQGFNQLALSVPDFDLAVQRAINRIQTQADTSALVRAAREQGYRSVSIDLICGLPLQTLSTIAYTLKRVIDTAPDSIALRNFEHQPQLFKSQRLIRAAELPSPERKREMLDLCRALLTNAGYRATANDHFTRTH